MTFELDKSYGEYCETLKKDFLDCLSAYIEHLDYEISIKRHFSFMITFSAFAALSVYSGLDMYVSFGIWQNVFIYIAGLLVIALTVIPLLHSARQLSSKKDVLSRYSDDVSYLPLDKIVEVKCPVPSFDVVADDSFTGSIMEQSKYDHDFFWLCESKNELDDFFKI